MKTHKVGGGGGVQLNVVETGNPRGRAILFLHGTSQCWMQWNQQLNSSLTENFRLIAMDLRGHGLSDKPRDAYTDSRLWADDVNAVISVLELDHPVLSGWSYGPLIILDYIRHYGEERLGGIQFIGGITKLGSEDAASVFTPEILNVIPQFLSEDAETSVRGLEALLRLCFASTLPASELYLMLGYNASVPPYVRQGLFSRSISNDDLLPKIHKPVLITHGAADSIVKRAAVERHKAAIPHAQIQIIENAGHGAFWDDPLTFNERLGAFCKSL